MRTDSPRLSDNALTITRVLVHTVFGSEYLGTSEQNSTKNTTKKAVTATKKTSKNDDISGSDNSTSVAGTPKAAQEAHEAIRPSEVDIPDTPEGAPTATGRFYQPHELDTVESLNELHRSLYTLIYQRTLASQMSPSVSDSFTYTITATSSSSTNQHDSSTNQHSLPSINEARFRTSHTKLKFPGFLAVYDKYKTRRSADNDDESSHLSDEDGDGTSNSVIDALYSQLHIDQQLYLCPDSAASPAAGSLQSSLSDSDDGESPSQASLVNAEEGKDKAMGAGVGSTGVIQMSSIVGMEHTTRPPQRYVYFYLYML